jgi:heme/copper-type cytochrome/quinol oxidase subunit 2
LPNEEALAQQTSVIVIVIVIVVVLVLVVIVVLVVAFTVQPTTRESPKPVSGPSA